MQYSLEKISATEACDGLLTLAHKKKQTLERKRRNLGESIERFQHRLERLNQQTAVVQLTLEAYVATYNKLPDGSKDKVSINIEVKHLEYRKARLEKTALTCNVRALLKKQIHYNRLDSQMAAIDYYIMALQNHKTALSNNVIAVATAEDRSTPAFVHPISQTQKEAYKMQTHFSPPGIKPKVIGGRKERRFSRAVLQHATT